MNKSLSEERSPIIANFEDGSRVIGYVYPEEDVRTFIKKLNDWWHSDDDQRSMKEFLKDEAGDDLL